MNRSEEIRIMSLPKMQEKFREAMGLIQLGDLCLYQDDVFIVTDKDDYYKTVCLIRLKVFEDEANEFWPTEKSVIHLPLPIDPVNPERGLWGMVGNLHGVGWEGFSHVWCVLVAGKLVDSRGITGIRYPALPRRFYGDTPTLALLKALAHQWGIDLEEK